MCGDKFRAKSLSVWLISLQVSAQVITHSPYTYVARQPGSFTHPPVFANPSVTHTALTVNTAKNVQVHRLSRPGQNECLEPVCVVLNAGKMKE